MPNTNKNYRNGQSIIEALVALSILTVGFLGILTLLTKSFQLNRVVSDETTATYLASEGIEVAKSLIDHGVYVDIATGGGAGGWQSCFSAPGPIYYELDYASTDCRTLISSANPVSYPIYFDSTTGLYSDNSGLGTQTIFSREIAITVPPADNGNMIDVQSIVTWSPTAFTTQSITLEDQFYNWHPTN